MTMSDKGCDSGTQHAADVHRTSLTNDEIGRYSRQMILPCMGLAGQLALVNAKVLVVGAGGLGCPVGMYLAAAGIGTLGFVDDDTVDVSNLHRQVLHTEDRVGVHKVDSIIASLKSLNSNVHFVAHKCRLTPSNALAVMRGYDVVVDATDNAPTRYLVNDACVLLDLPLVSGSALRTDGQLTVYNYKGSPCYRCLFPDPPPASTVTNCSDGGVIGVRAHVCASVMARRMLVADAAGGLFRTIKLRPRRPDCVACGEGPNRMQALLEDYVSFCHMDACDVTSGVSLRDPSQRLTAPRLRDLLHRHRAPATRTNIIDVRPAVEFGICSLPNTLNVPLATIKRVARRGFSPGAEGAEAILQRVIDMCLAGTGDRTSTSAHDSSCGRSHRRGTAVADSDDDDGADDDGADDDGADDDGADGGGDGRATVAVETTSRVIAVCRRGNDSQHAAVLLEQIIRTHAASSSNSSGDGGDGGDGNSAAEVQVLDVVGGLHAWSKAVDPSFPTY
ncbi:sulfurtransferase MOCS3 [Salpingoeca rosetta]|uniref:Adenylyltransferase and sulfurtransferase MOCS3 homolog n=1 Tax=Salpingoeca rosetta (strain ATCC 50818 / BSB-021) TaxID=946362 RepID=F2UJC0_SALR5|nr:sulfurtransferase MOCS3 [Salpingoeca rosetta]EGD77219.1 sulfurtransferase MOCS3 [Salpingoeca rosetta]|eukprot:XP_004990563.1 sulfurtransferase MOCS3 [Salpingoeca rosetta]